MSTNNPESQLIALSHGARSGRIRILLAVALFVLGQFAPLAHALSNDHSPLEDCGTAITVECSFCEGTAVRPDEPLLESAGASPIARPFAGALVSISSRRGAATAQFGLNLARGPPLQA